MSLSRGMHCLRMGWALNNGNYLKHIKTPCLQGVCGQFISHRKGGITGSEYTVEHEEIVVTIAVIIKTILGKLSYLQFLVACT